MAVFGMKRSIKIQEASHCLLKCLFVKHQTLPKVPLFNSVYSTYFLKIILHDYMLYVLLLLFFSAVNWETKKKNEKKKKKKKKKQ